MNITNEIILQVLGKTLLPVQEEKKIFMPE